MLYESPQLKILDSGIYFNVDSVMPRNSNCQEWLCAGLKLACHVHGCML